MIIRTQSLLEDNRPGVPLDFKKAKYRVLTKSLKLKFIISNRFKILYAYPPFSYCTGGRYVGTGLLLFQRRIKGRYYYVGVPRSQYFDFHHVDRSIMAHSQLVPVQAAFCKVSTAIPNLWISSNSFGLHLGCG